MAQLLSGRGDDLGPRGIDKYSTTPATHFVREIPNKRGIFFGVLLPPLFPLALVLFPGQINQHDRLNLCTN